MKENNVNNLAGLCSILLGIFTAAGAILYFLLPDAQKLGVPGNQILPSFAQDPTLLNLENIALGFVGILGLAVVPAVARVLRANENDWLRWTSNLASVGYAVSAVGSFIILSRLPVIAAAFEKGDASTKAALAATWRTTLDPLGLWGYGAVGLWILVVSLTLVRGTEANKAFPATLSYLGVIVALVHWLVPVAFLTRLPVLFFAVAGVGMIAITLWYVWLGVILRRT